MIAAWTSACSWSTPTPTTSRSAPARRWRSTSPRARGVTLVTCTGGEMGEILVPELEHLAADQDDTPRRAPPRRARRRDDGPRGHRPPLPRRLRALPRLRHGSGTRTATRSPATTCHDNAFWNADLTEAADHLVEVIREVRPQVLVTYDQFGNYGHPDHIQAHRVAMYAAQLAAVPSYRRDLGEAWEIAKIYWAAMSESRMRARPARRCARPATPRRSRAWTPTARCRCSHRRRRTSPPRSTARPTSSRRWTRCAPTATQIAVDGPFFALSNNIGNEVWGTEYFRIAKGAPAPVGEDGLETDLFAGL